MELEEKISEIKRCTSFESIASLLVDEKRSAFASQQIYAIDRVLEKLKVKPHQKIAYLTNFTINFLPAHVNVYAASEGIYCGAYVGAYNQYFQEILNEKGPLKNYEPDIIFISLSIKNLEPQVSDSFLSLNDTEKENLIKKIVGHCENLISEISKRFNSSVLLSNFALPVYNQSGIADVNNRFSEMQFYYRLNIELSDLVLTNHKVHIFDVAKLAARFGSERAFDPKMYYMAKILWSEKFLGVFAEEILRYLIAINGFTRKCLALDLDNTLWGGIVGEDGPLGVKIGHGDPIGEAYLDFQHKIKSLKNRGIMLSICSKNNRNDVIEAFEKRNEMPLKLSDFAATQINWNHKHINLQRLADELNIGLDSFVFVDDNPVEIGLIQQMLPQVKSVLLPSNPEAIPQVLDDLVVFEKLVLLEDDLRKTEQYQQNKQRQSYKENVGDLKSYLHSLETEISIRSPHKEDLNRVHQLFTKTNQFNVTTIRYSIGDIERFMDDDKWDLTIVSTKDKFGDLGIVGLYLLEIQDSKVKINSFILSCRAMGRGIESAIMNHIKDQYCKRKEPVDVEAFYYATPKNKPVENFFDQQHFEVIDVDDNGGKSYRLLSKNSEPVECSWIKVVE